MGMLFVKKVENGGCFVKKVENGFFCKKKWTFPQCRVHYVQYQYFFLHFTYLGGIRTPLPTGLGWKTQKTNQHRFIWMTSTNTEVIKLSIINA